jgi:type IV secretory pathway VirB9-like protein
MAKTTVFLPYGDKPISQANGSPEAFKIELPKEDKSKYDLSNTFTISSKYVRTDTTLTIIGASGRVYNFYIYSVGLNSKVIPNSTVFITLDGKMPLLNKRVDLNEKDKQILALKNEIKQYKEKLDITIQKETKNLKKFNIASIQLDYKFDDDFNLAAVFNDDEYTYFKFKDKFNIPKFYYVDEKKDKITLNFIMFENIIKVHKLSSNWSLELNGEILEIKKIGNFEIEYSNKKLYVDMTKTKYNIKSISGDDKLKPQIIFYDKQFTYFKFDMSSGFNAFPLVYRVVDGYDNFVDTEIVNDYVVVKTLHDGFTLRLGELHNCIRLAK